MTSVEDFSYHPTRRNLFTEFPATENVWVQWVIAPPNPFVFFQRVNQTAFQVIWQQTPSASAIIPMELVLPIQPGRIWQPIFGRIEYSEPVPLDFTLSLSEWTTTLAVGLPIQQTGRFLLNYDNLVGGPFIVGEILEFRTEIGNNFIGTRELLGFSIGGITPYPRAIISPNIGNGGDKIIGLTSGATARHRGAQIESFLTSPFVSRGDYFTDVPISNSAPFTFGFNTINSIRGYQAEKDIQMVIDLKVKFPLPVNSTVKLTLFFQDYLDMDRVFKDFNPITPL